MAAGMAQAIANPCFSLDGTSDALSGGERPGDPAQAAARLRRRKLDRLRQRIRRIERDTGLTMQEPIPSAPLRDHRSPDPPATSAAPPSLSLRPADHDARPIWRLGADEVDALLGSEGLEVGGVHEVKPALRGPGVSWAAAW